MGILKVSYEGKFTSIEIVEHDDFEIKLLPKDFDRLEILMSLTSKLECFGIRINRYLTIQFAEDTAFLNVNKKYIFRLRGLNNFVNFVHNMLNLNHPDILNPNHY